MYVSKFPRVKYINMIAVAVIVAAVIILAFLAVEGMIGAPRLTPNCACPTVPGPLSARVNPWFWPDSGADCTPLFSPTTPDHVEMI